jgi:hypothetical protein
MSSQGRRTDSALTVSASGGEPRVFCATRVGGSGTFHIRLSYQAIPYRTMPYHGAALSYQARSMPYQLQGVRAALDRALERVRTRRGVVRKAGGQRPVYNGSMHGELSRSMNH